MGRDKAGLCLNGESLLERAVRRYSGRFGAENVFVAPGRRSYGFGAAEIPDIFPDCGPISALHAALTKFAANAAGVFLTAVDMPLTDPALAEKLIDFAEKSGKAAVLAENCGKSETLFAWYGSGVLAEAELAIKRGEYSVFDLAKRCGYAEFSVAEAETLVNANTPEEFAEIRRAGEID
jgi:molybdopterin-guanine dinucleotide biosynthesis protein A